jgi:hypothetical protein
MKIASAAWLLAATSLGIASTAFGQDAQPGTDLVCHSTTGVDLTVPVYSFALRSYRSQGSLQATLLLYSDVSNYAQIASTPSTTYSSCTLGSGPLALRLAKVQLGASVTAYGRGVVLTQDEEVPGAALVTLVLASFQSLTTGDGATYAIAPNSQGTPLPLPLTRHNTLPSKQGGR